MVRLFGLVASLAGGVVLLGSPAFAAAQGAGPEALPEVLVRLPQGTISAADFRTALRDQATINPRRFKLGDAFLRHTIIIMEAVKRRLPTPSADAVTARIREQEEQLRGTQGLEQQLRAIGLTRDDLRRMVREGLLFEAIVRQIRKLPADAQISHDQIETAYRELWQAYKPVFHGVGGAQRAATVGGINFTAAEVVEYLVQWGEDRVLRDVLEQLITERLVLQEAQRRGISAVGLGPEEALAKVLAPALTPEKLEAYFKSVAETLEILRVAHIFCAYDPRPGKAYEPQVMSAEAQTAARMRAEALHARLRQGEISFAEAARKFSNCYSASQGGDLGYLADSLSVSLNLPPQAYALDFLRTRRGLRSPISAPPDPRILKAAKALKDGEISAPVHTRTGYSIVKRIEARSPRSAQAMHTYLRRRRFLELRSALLDKLRQRVDYAWTPQQRLNPQPPTAAQTQAPAVRARHLSSP